MYRLTILAAAVLLTGCAATRPAVRVEYSHRGHTVAVVVGSDAEMVSARD